MSAVIDRTAFSSSPLLGVYKPAPPIFVGGRGSHLIDETGREYLDFTSGIGVNALGYGDTELAHAIENALSTGIVHTSNLFRTSAALRLAEQLVARSFADKVFFCNSGAEAVEGALKFARRWARDIGGPAKHEFIATRSSFHGRLFGTLSVTDRPALRDAFEPVMPGVRFVGVGDSTTLGAVISRERTAAIIIEPVQGEGGIQPVPEPWLRRLREAADAAQALLIYDEVQCGLGRTGHLFAYEASGVAPDLLALAKPLAGGLPMGAILLTARVASAIRPGDHATTFGGGPVVSAAALHVLSRVADPQFLARVRALGEHIDARLADWTGKRGVVEVRGLGLMWGIETAQPVGPVMTRALEAGLLVVPAGAHVVRLLPPLTISEADLDAGLDVLWSVLE